MPRIKAKNFETFQDGELTLCECKNRTLIRTIQSNVRFGNRTIGAVRFWNAKVDGTVLSKMIAIPIIPEIHQKNILLIENRQYEIVQIQEKMDTKPPCYYLSLKSIQTSYKDERGVP